MEESFKRSTEEMSRVMFELSGWNRYRDSSDNETDIITTTPNVKGKDWSHIRI